MKIYHTETQEDYDALMIELEEQGCKWLTGDRPTKTTYWHLNREKTCVNVQPEGEMRITSKKYHSLFHPEALITKYKAKADDKMKFTKENAWQKVKEWLDESQTTQKELRDRINELDDTPEKVVVPKFVAEFYEKRKHYILSVIFDEFKRSEERKVADWYIDGRSGGRHVNGLANSQETIAKMHLHGYTIEEPLYEVVIHETKDDRLLLVANKSGYKFELESNNEGFWKQRHTKSEIKIMDKRYWPFAVPVEE